MVSNGFLVKLVFGACVVFTGYSWWMGAYDEHSGSLKFTRFEELLKKRFWSIANFSAKHHGDLNHNASVCHSKYDSAAVTDSVERPRYPN